MPDESKDRPRRITAQMKFQVYLETRRQDDPIGEILRRYGMQLADLRAIEGTVEQASVSALKLNGGRRSAPSEVPGEEYQRVIRELQEKEKALADLTVEYQLFKKKQRLESELGRKTKSSRPR